MPRGVRTQGANGKPRDVFAARRMGLTREGRFGLVCRRLLAGGVFSQLGWAASSKGRFVYTLYSYFRSSASYRVRIALAYKGLNAAYVPVHLVKGEQRSTEFLQVSAAGLVPALQVDDAVLTQSLAILEYLEETHPSPPLLPADALARARVRALALDVACEIHPLNNLRVLKFLVDDMQLSEDAKLRWLRHWIETGLAQVEARLDDAGPHCTGAQPTMADVVLVPQIFNAQRFSCELSHVPRVMRVFEACMALPAFASTQPSACPDAA
jgi:maleylacetoacetate isomerase/maleylpyruvate isomerase